MSETDKLDAELADVDPGRRAFIKRMAVGAAVTPVVTSFTMSGLITPWPAFAQAANGSP